MGGLWKQVGLKGAPVRLVGHAIAQVNYDGDWHVMDGDLGILNSIGMSVRAWK